MTTHATIFSPNYKLASSSTPNTIYFPPLAFLRCDAYGRASFTEAFHAEKTIAFSLLLSTVSLSLASAEPVFQRAQSEAERALEAVINKEVSDNGFATYLMREGSDKTDEKYSVYFTPAYKPSVIKEQKKLCGGKKPTNDCIFEFSPLSCSQEVPEDNYIYQTQHLTDTEATIAYAWPNTDKAVARYRLLKDKSGWKIDGVECVGGPKFNMN